MELWVFQQKNHFANHFLTTFTSMNSYRSTVLLLNSIFGSHWMFPSSFFLHFPSNVNNRNTLNGDPLQIMRVNDRMFAIKMWWREGFFSSFAFIFVISFGGWCWQNGIKGPNYSTKNGKWAEMLSNNDRVILIDEYVLRTLYRNTP